VLVKLAAAVTLAGIALAGCGSTKTIVTVETHTVTVPVTRTQTVTTTSPGTTSALQGTKCGGKTTYCPVVVACPMEHGAPARHGCSGVIGVSGINLVGPSPGPDKTGLGLDCSWTQPVFDAASVTYDYICDLP
jgi:hypothetical protein